MNGNHSIKVVFLLDLDLAYIYIFLKKNKKFILDVLASATHLIYNIYDSC